MVDFWMIAKSPDYETNKDKLYPYSELPYQNDYKVVKIPYCIKNLIEHVDYYGKGRIELDTGTIGFPDCYNINGQYNLVTNDPIENRKIPNRIPIFNGSAGYSTRHYIKDNSVLTVTLTLIPNELKKTMIQDIARIVNADRGKVIIYGYTDKQAEMITDELKETKQLFYCPIYLLPDNLRLTFCNTLYRAYLNINALKKELYRNIKKGDVEAAVILTGCLANPYGCEALGDVINKLLKNNVGNVIMYAYKLWNTNYKDVVRSHFPTVFHQIFNGDCMVIINKQNNQALVLDPKTTQAQGDSHYKSNNKLGWKITPIWDANNVVFKLYNIDSDMYLQLSPTVGENGVRQASGSKDSKELRDKFYFEPLIVNGEVAFTIFNCENDQKLDLPDDVNSPEDKADLGQKGVGSNREVSSWMLAPSNQVKEKDERTQSDEDEEICNIYDYD